MQFDPFNHINWMPSIAPGTTTKASVMVWLYLVTHAVVLKPIPPVPFSTITASQNQPKSAHVKSSTALPSKWRKERGWGWVFKSGALKGGYVTAYWRTKPKKAKLTGYSNSQVRRLQCPSIWRSPLNSWSALRPWRWGQKRVIKEYLSSRFRERLVLWDMIRCVCG